MTLWSIDGLLAGTVRTADGVPVAGLPVTALHPLGAVAPGLTATDGRYLLGVSSEPSGMRRAKRFLEVPS